MSACLTDFCVNGGCGCKIDPTTLQGILSKVREANGADSTLLVGASQSDDAAVVKIDEERGLVSTTDFFTPIVNDPYDFGRIAACNALSDVYAMGAKPILAVGILGWPSAEKQLGPDVAARVIDGALAICREARIPLGGGHSIISSEPFFGLAVNGIVPLAKVKRNGAEAVDGARLYLTKPLGVGIKALAYKNKLISSDEFQDALLSMTTLNVCGERFGNDERVVGLTDITGFGLLGHLREVCEASALTAEVHLRDLPLLNGLEELVVGGKVRTGASRRNWASVEEAVVYEGELTDVERAVLTDPQTSGPLLVITRDEFELDHSLPLYEIGVLRKRLAAEADATRIVLMK